MALSKIEQLLIDGLKICQLRRGNIILAMFLMDTDEKRWDLINFLEKILLSEEQISEDDIMNEVQRIART